MTPRARHLVALALLCVLAAGPAGAASSTASSAVGGSSASVGSVSTSFQQSSGSSSKTNTAAAGDYRIVEVAEVAERPGFVRLNLRALAGADNGVGDGNGNGNGNGNGKDSGFALIVPQATVLQGGLAAGHIVSARPRPYGTEFASAATQQAFFLLLTDDWYRELKAHAVVL